MNGKTITEVVLEATKDANADKVTIDKLETLDILENEKRKTS
jgi:hypothetical protein